MGINQAVFDQKKEMIEQRKELNQALMHHKMVYEMEKTDVKKGLKRILTTYLKDRENMLDFQKTWITILFFFTFQQMTATDYKALKSQFKQHTKMAALLRLYTTQYLQYIERVGPNFTHRLIVNAGE